MSDLETIIANLTTRKLAITVELAGMGPTKAGGLPNMSGGAGANIKHVEYRLSLMKEMEIIDELLLQAREVAAATGGDTVWEWES